MNDSISLDPARLENVKHLDGGSVEFNPLVSFFKNAYENLPTDIPAAQFIASTKGNEHKRLVEEIRERFQRALSRGVEYSQAKRTVDTQKKKLPCVSFAGVLPMRDKKATPKFTGLFQADLDLLGDRLSEIRGTLRDDPHVYSLFVSPTGEGLKAIYRVPICKTAEEYKAAFAAVSARVQDLTGVEIDKLEDFTRLCFASHDPDACLNPNAVELPVDFSQPAEEIKPTPAATVKIAPSAAAESRRAIAERVLGTVEWQDEVLGDCHCPGEAHHTTGEKPHECQVHLDRVPTIFCLHKTCESAVAEKNHRLRSEIGKAEKAAAPGSKRADIAAGYLGEEIEQAASEKGFTIRTPDEILAMRFDDSDRMLGDHLLDDGGQLALLGAGGVGKSRLLLLMLACIAGARRFLTFDTFKPEMKWLVLQTENSNRRLQQDFAPLKAWLGDDWPRFTERVTIHTVETDSDAFVNLDDPDAVARIEAAIQKHKPDGIAVDPLADFAAGDLNKDADMKLTLQSLSRLCRRGNPKRAIIVLHHAITGRGGAAKATGYDRASFARNSKMLHAWARGQINLAPVDPDSNDRLIIACGKCSNGREFQTFAVRLNPDTMIYECDPTVDVSQWERDITGSKDNTPLMNPDRVRELCTVTGSSKAALAKSIMDDCGCYRGSAYRYIARAEQSKKITFNKSHETYFRK
jgi:hypothetical protein